jgi:hypothetical protein
MAGSEGGINIFMPVVVGAVTTAVTIVIHALALRTVIQFVRRERSRGHAASSSGWM